MSRIVGPVTYHDDNRLTLAGWRARWPHKLVTREDGHYTVHDSDIGSTSRSSLWHLVDYQVVAVRATTIVLAPRAIVD